MTSHTRALTIMHSLARSVTYLRSQSVSQSPRQFRRGCHQGGQAHRQRHARRRTHIRTQKARTLIHTKLHANRCTHTHTHRQTDRQTDIYAGIPISGTRNTAAATHTTHTHSIVLIHTNLLIISGGKTPPHTHIPTHSLARLDLRRRRHWRG